MLLQISQSVADHFQHAIKIVVDICVTNPYHLKTKQLQSAGTRRVVSQLGIRTMCCAINLDDQLGIEGYEIDDISIDRILATKFVARQSAVSQRLPQPRLSIGLRCT